jgi:peptide/nickel transport system substrate-binding protein
MIRAIIRAAVAAALAVVLSSGTAAAQKHGGILKMYIWDNPPSMSMLESSNVLGQRVTMGLFNNLIMFDQHVKQSSLESIVPDLATGWSWNEEGTALTLPLRQGVKWHDGKSFTAKDIQCTWDLLLDKSSDKLKVNTIKSWYHNVQEVTTNGDWEVTFRLKRPQPAFPMLLANGFAPVYPCHVPARDMRTHPIGTGPFKFVEFKPNESIKVTRNPSRKLRQEPVTGVLHYPAAVLGDFRLDQLPEVRHQPFVRPLFICPHQARVPRHVGGENRGEAADRGHFLARGGRSA